jgi:curli biogenesis system outer membrane secretion channel CsgG
MKKQYPLFKSGAEIRTVFGCLLLMLFSAQSASSQKMEDPKVTFENIKAKCKNVPPEHRIIVTVTSFKVTAGNAPAALGDNLATMLTNALQQVDCFRVLESLKNMSDVNGEIDYSKSEYSDPNTEMEKGKQLSPQLVIGGELTEYSLENNSGGALFVHVSSTHSKMGFILKLINPKTREIMASFEVHVEGKSGGSANVFGVHGGHQDPAVADAMERGIVKATDYLVDEMGKLNLPAPNASASGNTTLLTLNNVDFSKAGSVLDMIKGLDGVMDVKRKSFSGNVAVYVVSTKGSTDDLVSAITTKGSFDVVEVSSGKATLAVK